MRYTFLLYSDPSDFADMTPEDWAREKEVYGAYIGALQDAGVFVDTDWLQPADTATTITLKDGERRVQDGPYAETRETLGGFFAIDVPDLDAALAWAEKCPAAKHGKVEIRASAMGGA
ncbi:MAG: YciI family protein [Pseudomonadota bacterium]